MVAIVSGYGLGLLTGSAGVLGQQGLHGNAVLGNNREAAYLNVFSGNLVLQDSDDFLAAHGVNLAITRTYNSQGSVNDGSGAWKYGLLKQVSALTGAVNTAGSTVRRTAGDGSVSTFSWNAAKAAYTSTDGGGATQSLQFNATTHEWTWRGDRYDSTGVCEVYDDNNGGRLVRTEDNGVVRQRYSYNAAGHLAQVTDAAGTAGVATDATNNVNDQTFFDYDANGNLSQIRTVLAGTAGAAVQSMVRTHYGYDAQNRLSTVTVDLSSVAIDPVSGKPLPTADNNSVADGASYTTTYSYDGASDRISKVSQSDGTELNLTYRQVGATWKVDSCTDGLGRKTSIDYSVPNKATVTDALGLQTTYGFDALGQLTDVSAPAINGVSQLTHYSYDGNGNVASVTDARGLTTNYRYDANNNCILQWDSSGYTTRRSYDLTSNKLLAEARYIVADADGAGAAALPADAARTSYVYDAANRLRYVIDPDFRLTEYRYNATGEVAAEIRYPDKFWSSAGFGDLSTATETSINAVVAGTYYDKRQSVRTDYNYDARGLLRSATRYANVGADGTGLLDGQQSVSTYVYDQAGQLLYSRDGNGNLSTKVYDGLGRLISQTDASGTQLKSVYDSRSNLTVTSTASGAGSATVSTSYVHDQAGQIVSVQQQYAAGPGAGTTRNTYDSDGQLRMSTSPDGMKTYWLYDEAGRKVAQIDNGGALTEYTYNASNALVGTIRYATPVSTAGLVDGQGLPSAITLATLRPGGASRASWNGYDLNGRLVASVDANGIVTRMSYDGLNRLTSSTVRATPISLAALGMAPVNGLLPGEVVNAADDRTSYHLYDHAGHQVGTIDALGYLTENRYDAGGRLVETIAYKTPTAAATRASGNLSTVRPGTTTADLHQHLLYDGQDRLIGSIDGDNYLTEISYDAAGNVSSRRRYATPVTAPAGLTLATVGKAISAYDRVTTYSYTALNQLDKETDPAGTFSQYRYDDNGKVIAITHGSAGIAERTSRVRYDGAGRLIGELSAQGVERLAALGAQPSADAVAQVWALYGSHYSYDLDGLRTSMTDVQGNRTLYFYDSLGRLTHTVNGTGEVQEQRYNVYGQVIKTIQYGKRIDAGVLATLSGGQHDAAFNALNLAGGSDIASAFYYDDDGQLRYTVDGSGQIQERRYNSFGQLTQAIRYSSLIGGAALATLSGGAAADANFSSYLGGAAQRTLSYFDADGQLRYSVDPLGQVQGQTYDAFGRLDSVTSYATRVANPAALTGANAESAAFAVALPANSVQSYAYNHRGGVVDLAINGNHTLTTYNGFGQATKVDHLANANSTTPLAAADQVIQTVYDGNGRVQASIDGTGTVTAYQYDGDGHVIDQLRYANALAGYATTTDIAKTYADALAAGTLSDPARNQHQRFIYDGNGDLCVTLTAQSTTVAKDAQNHDVVTVQWDVVRQTRDDARRVATRTAYAMRMQSATLAPATADVLSWMASADARNLNDPTLTNAPPANAGPYDRLFADGGPVSDAIVRYVYDGANRVVATATAQRRDASNVITWSVQRQEYDARGNVIARTQLANQLTGAIPADGAILAVALAPAADAVTRYNYDGANRVTMTAVAQGPAAPDAVPPSPQRWALTSLRYDNFGNLMSRVQYATLATTNTPPADLGTLVSADAAADRATGYRYDALNRLAVTIDATGALTRLVYDSRGDVAQTIAYAVPTSNASLVDASYNPVLTPADRVTRTVHDLQHRPVFEIDALGQVTEHDYDPLGNLSRTIRYATALTPAKLATLAATGADAGVSDVRALLAAPSLTLDRITRYAYDQDGQLRYTVDPAGYLKETIYNALGQVAETRDYLQLPPAALSAAPTLAELGNEATRQYNAGYASVNKFSYDSKGNLIASTDPQAATESWRYDGLGNKISYTNKAGSTWAYRYDAAGHMVEETSPQVAVYAANFGIAMGNWGAGTQMALVTRMEYDALGNLKRRIEAAGSANERATSYRYDAQGRQTQIILAPARIYDDANDPKRSDTAVAATEKDSGPRVTTVRYDAFGDAVANTDVGGNTSYKVYDLRGQVAYEIDAMGYVTGHAHDSFGNQTALTRYADPLWEPYDGTTAWLRTPDQFKAHIALNGPEDRTIRTAYDLLGRVIKVSAPITAVFDQQSRTGSPYLNASKTTDTAYTTFGEVRQQTTYGAGYDGARLTDGSDTLYYYDARGNKSTEINVLTNAADGHTGTGYVTSYVYGFDTASKTSTVTKTEFATADGWDDRLANGGPLPGSAPAQDRVTRQAYDKSGQLVSDTRVNVSYYSAVPGADPVRKTGDIVTRYGYDVLGRQNAVTDALGGTTYTYYDALGHTIAVAKAQAPGVTEVDAAAAPLSEFKLDLMGNVVYRIDYADGASGAISAQGYSVTDAARANENNRVTLSLYDADGHATSVLDAEQFALLAHNNAGGILSNINSFSTIHTSYDVYGRVAKQWRNVTSDGQLQTSFQITRYDALGRVREEETPGQVDLVTGQAAQRVRKSSTYNGFGEVLNTFVATGNDAAQDASTRQVVSYTRYDQAGNAWNSNGNDGVDTVSLFDALGRVTAQVRSTGEFQHALAVLGAANDVLNLPNQLRTETLYDRLGHVIDATTGNTQLSVLQLHDGVWTVTAPGYRQDDNDSLIVIGRPEDQAKTINVQYRLKPNGGWTDAGGRVQWIDGHPVFSTGGLADGDYEFQVRMTPPGEPAYNAGGGTLHVTGATSTVKNQQLAALFLMVLGRGPEPAGMNWWLDKYNQGAPLAQIAGGIFNSAEAKALLTGDSKTIMAKLFQAVGHALWNDPGCDKRIALWAGRLDQAGADPMKQGQVIASLLETAMPQLAARANAIVNYLLQGGNGNDAGFNNQLTTLADSALDPALALGTARARLDTQDAGLARLYLGLFSRAPDKSGFSFWHEALKNGGTLEQVALEMLKGAEANDPALLPSATLSAEQYNDKLVKLAYANLVGRAPTDAELAAAKATLGGGAPNLAQASFLVSLGNQVASYAGADPAQQAARALLFDKVTVCLAYADMPSQAGDLQQMIAVNKAVIAAIGSAADAQTAAANATQLLKTRALAAQALVGSTQAALDATPLENLRLKLAQLYSVVLNRAPEHDGFQFWMNPLQANGLSYLPTIARDMLNQEGSNNALYPPTLSNKEFLTRVFSLGLGFPPGTLLDNAVNAWLPRLGANTATVRGQAIVDIINSLVDSNTATDQPMRDLLANRAAVGVTYAGSLGASDPAMAKSVMALVTATDIKSALDSVTDAVKAAAAAAANANLAALRSALTLNTDYVRVAQQNAAALGGLPPAQKAADANPTATPLLRAAMLYVSILNRNNTNRPDLDLYGLTNMAQVIQGGAGDVLMAQSLFDSPEGQLVFPPNNYNATAFVTQLYHQALNRDPDPASLARWVAAAPNLASRAQVAVDLLKSFLSDPIGDSDPDKASKLQSQAAFYARMSTALTKLAAVQDDTVAAQTAANDAATKATAADSTARAVTTAVNKAATTNARLVLEVTRLFVGILNRGATVPIDISGLNFWTNARLQGASVDTLADDFLRSTEGLQLFQNATTNQAFVSQIFQQVLGRTPAPGDNFWVDQMNKGASRATIAAGIIRSLCEETYPADTEYTAKANFDQRVGDAMRALSASAANTARTAAANVVSTLQAKNVAAAAVQPALTALQAANKLTVDSDPAVVAAVAAAPRGSAYLNSPNRQTLTEVLVAFKLPSDFNTVSNLLQGLANGTTTFARIIAPAAPSLANRATFYTTLYNALLGRPPEPNGLDWWVTHSTGYTDAGEAAYGFFVGARAEMYAPLAISKRPNFKAEFDAVNNANVATATAMANGVAPARDTATQQIAQKQSQAQQAYQDALNKAAATNQAWQDATATSPVAQAAPAALAAAITVQNAAVIADKAMAASLTAKAKMPAMAALVNLPATATLADYTALATAVANVKRAATLDATLEKAHADLATADAARMGNVQSQAAANALTAQVTTITRVYVALTNRGPSQLELNAALGAFRSGQTADDLAASVMAANPTIYTAGMSNDAFITRIYLTAFNRNPELAGLRFWSDQLGGANPVSRGAMVNRIILSVTHDSFNSDSVTFGGKVGINLGQEATAAQAAVNNVGDFIAANAAAMNAEASRFDAAAQAAQPAAARYASQMTQLYQAVLGRAPEPSALLNGVTQLLGGTALQTIADSMLNAPETAARLSPSLTNAQFVTAFYTLGLGRPADATENAAALAALNAGTPRAQLVLRLIGELVAYSGGDSVKLAARTAFMAKVSADLARSVIDVGAYAGTLQVAADRSDAMDDRGTLKTAADGRLVGHDSSTRALAKLSTAHMTVDRWGNVLTVSDQRDANWKITYQYDYNNQQIDQTLNALSPAGAAHSATGYDQLGRQVLSTDYNRNTSSRRYDANGNVTQEKHADGGVVTSRYTLFGQRLSVAQPNTVLNGATRYGVLTTYTYDHLGHVATVSTGSTNLNQLVDVYSASFYDIAWNANDAPTHTTTGQLTTRYTYDELGRAISNTSADGATSYTSYDLDGNVIKTIGSYKARGVQYTPNEHNAIPDEVQTVTLNAFDAYHHLIRTRDGNGNTMSWDTDSFGRVKQHIDLGGAVITTRYNAAGQMTSQTTVRSDRTTYTNTPETLTGTVTYGYTDGLLTSIDQGDTGLDFTTPIASHAVIHNGMLTTYSYDAAGNRITERQSYHAGRDHPASRLQNNKLSYDMQNRLTVAKDDQYTLTYTYDDNGNRTSVRTNDGVNREYTAYNTYDRMNRQTIVNGDLGADGRTPVYGAHGHQIVYDLSGNRVSDTYRGLKLSESNGNYSTTANQVTTESYTYDAVGRLVLTQRDGVTIDQRRYDAANRVTQSGFLDYVAFPLRPSSSVSSLDSMAQAIGLQSGTTTYHYDDNGRIQRQTLRGLTGSINVDNYYVQDAGMGSRHLVGGYDGAGNLLGYTQAIPSRKVEDWGRFQLSYKAFDSYKEATNRVDQGDVSASDYDVYGNRTTVMKGNKLTTELWYDANGHVQSKIDYANKDQNGNPTSTFAMIVNDQVLGYEDHSDTNILGSSYTGAISVAQTSAPSAYTVQRQGETPQSIAQAIWGDSKLWYLIADANGLNAGDTLELNRVLNIPIRLNTAHNDFTTFQPYNASEAIGNTTPALPPPTHNSHHGGWFGKLVVGAIAVGISIMTGGIGGAMLGSVVSQLAGMALGVQDSFSWKSVMMAGVSAGIGEGVSSLAGSDGILSSIGSNSWTDVAARAAVSNIATQGVANLTGLQHGFNWTSVAASYAGAAASSQVGNYLGHSDAFKNAMGSYGGFANTAISSFASGVTSSVVRGGRIDVAQIATDAFGNALGSSLAESFNSDGRMLPRRTFNDAPSIGPVTLDAPQTDMKALLDSASTPIFVAGDGGNGSTVGGGTWPDDEGAYPKGNQYRFLTGGPAAAGAAGPGKLSADEIAFAAKWFNDASPKGGANDQSGDIASLADGLKVGSRGENVKRLQAALGIESDGIFGRATAAALADYNAASPSSYLGALSKQYEARNGVFTISSGVDDAGGVSYGAHQLATTPGTMADYIASPENANYAPSFTNLRPGTSAFNTAYLTVANADPSGFADAQHAYITRTHYKPVADYAANLGFDTTDRGVQEALYSQSVQHGLQGNQIILDNAAVNLPAVPANQISAIYAARGEYASRYASAAATTLRYAAEAQNAIRVSNYYQQFYKKH